MSGARSIHCQCDHHFTCGHCLANRKPWFFTPSTWREIIARQIARKPKEPKP